MCVLFLFLFIVFFFVHLLIARVSERERKKANTERRHPMGRDGDGMRVVQKKHTTLCVVRRLLSGF